MNSIPQPRDDGRRAKLKRSTSISRLPIRLPDPSTIAFVPPATSEHQHDLVSDERIAGQVHGRIAELGESITGRVVIRVHKGTIYVHGAVQSQYQRLVVTGALRRIRPDLLIRDRIEIVPTRSTSTPISLRSQLRHFVQGISLAAVLLTICVTGFYAMKWPENRGLTNVTVAVNADGQVANGAFLTLYPVNTTDQDAQVRSQGRVDDTGTVSWTTYEPADGLLPGEYVVTATWNRTVEVDGEIQPGPNLLRHIYETPDTSPMRLTVSAGSNELSTEPIVLSFQ